MNMYPIVRPVLFLLDPELAHELTLSALALAGKSGVLNTSGIKPNVADQPLQVMGIKFPNRIGLAAGLDKNAVAIDGLAALGFGFIEVGTVTPKPQSGNPKPRLFRLPREGAIINRMGFNNDGIEVLLANLASTRYSGILGINIGKNATTPIERAADDYLLCLDQAYPHATYITVNISSPNTKNLRQLQDASALEDLLGQLKARQQALADRHGRYVPMVLKIAPDIEDDQIQQIADSLRRHQIDGVIATNTTLSRNGVESSVHSAEAGGMSGQPLFEKSTEIVRKLARCLGGELPIIAAGGISSGADAKAKIEAGASLVQIYSGLIFRGPALITECRQALAAI